MEHYKWITFDIEDTLIPGALAILENLQDRATVVAGANGTSWIQRARIEKAGIEKFFKHIVVSEKAGVTKPNMGFYERLHAQPGYPGESGMLLQACAAQAPNKTWQCRSA